MKLGQKVLINHYLRRIWKESGAKCWETILIETKEVLLIGIRTLSDGIMQWEGDYYSYSPTNFFKGYLVVNDLKRKPFFVKEILLS
ncbi:hypothetical protein LCGC14_1143460 [marine sediment metagenome]|uniref:Uncharacterized protein n=1 Tax=marine sediment metagenome TaxID=412755 RepID=A0A0F9M2F1_9ZZZZ